MLVVKGGKPLTIHDRDTAIRLFGELSAAEVRGMALQTCGPETSQNSRIVVAGSQPEGPVLSFFFFLALGKLKPSWIGPGWITRAERMAR